MVDWRPRDIIFMKQVDRPSEVSVDCGSLSLIGHRYSRVVLIDSDSVEASRRRCVWNGITSRLFVGVMRFPGLAFSEASTFLPLRPSREISEFASCQREPFRECNRRRRRSSFDANMISFQNAPEAPYSARSGTPSNGSSQRRKQCRYQKDRTGRRRRDSQPWDREMLRPSSTRG
jgi:hypothetical protein